MVRKFHLYDGKKLRIDPYRKNIFTSLQSYAKNDFSNEFLQACEDTEVISITKSKYYHVFAIDIIGECGKSLRIDHLLKAIVIPTGCQI